MTGLKLQKSGRRCFGWKRNCKEKRTANADKQSKKQIRTVLKEVKLTGGIILTFATPCVLFATNFKVKVH